MPNYRVLITTHFPDHYLDTLLDIAEIIKGPRDGQLMPREEVLNLLPTIDAVINQAELQVDDELLDKADNLKIVANVSLGIDNLDLNAINAKGIWATNAGDIFVESTADATLCMLLCLARKIVKADDYVRKGQWDGFRPGPWDGILLSKKTLGIIGYGRIGKAVARRARIFGMDVVFNDPYAVTEPEYRDLESLLFESDFVSLHTPLTNQTRHLINSHTISLMKKGAYLINIARGPIVDENALIKALQTGYLAGAALDVFENEPEVPEALRNMDNVVLTPHIGGGTIESRQAAVQLAARNVASVLKGGRPITPVNDQF
jgi:glyoxylate reductase